MKGYEITKEQTNSWDKDGWFPVVCRLCGEVMLFPKKTYDPKIFEERSYECGCHERQLRKYGL